MSNPLLDAAEGTNTYLLSFDNEDENLGTVFVDAVTPCAALAKAQTYGINPGGDPTAYKMDLDQAERVAGYKNRLLTVDEAMALLVRTNPENP